MKKIIEKSFMCLLTVFFILFTVLIRKDAHEHLLIYSIGLILIGVLTSFLSFLLNNCKKLTSKRWYLISITSFGFSLIIHSIYLMLLNTYINNIETLSQIHKTFLWIQRIPLAIAIASSLFLLFYSVKDFFKKGYKIEKFDLYSFKMCLNTLVYLFMFFIVIDKGGVTLLEHLDPITFKVTHYTLSFKNYETVLYGSLIVLASYIALYFVIEYVKKVCFDKEKTSNNIYK